MNATENNANIAKEAAFLAAVLMDEALTPERRAVEIRDTLEELVPMLKLAGVMEPYRQESGAYGI